VIGSPIPPPRSSFLLASTVEERRCEVSDLVTLTLEIKPPDTAVVAAVGEIDLSNCEQLNETLASLDSRARVVVDLTECSFFDSSCLGVLTRHAHAAREDGRHFSVRVDDRGRRIIDITNLGELLRLDGG
jgi:anti-anti-sigma factor